VVRGDKLHLEVLSSIASQVEDLSVEVLEDDSRLDNGGGSIGAMRGGM